MKDNLIISIGVIAVGLFAYLIFKKRSMVLSKNFTLSEFERSDTATKYGINNKIPEMYMPNIKRLVLKILQPTRDFVGFPLKITSGYRSPSLMDALKKEGYPVSPTSDHRFGMAADIVSQDNAKVFNYIKDNLEFDQLIWERGNKLQPEWVHVSIRSSNNRNQILYT